MASPPGSAQRVGSAARSGLIGTVVAGFAFFDGIFLGAPIAVFAAASLRPSLVLLVGTIGAIFLVTACCSWVDRRWDDWFSGNGKRIETRLEAMRRSRLMRHPVAWVEHGSDRRYALAAALANPILVAALARFTSGKPIGERRILLGAVAFAIPYVAMWTIIGCVLGDAARAA